MPGVPWYQAMIAHCAIHGAAVALLTSCWWLFFFEFTIHFVTDDTKCEGRINYNQDQAIHLICKVVWWYFVIWSYS